MSWFLLGDDDESGLRWPNPPREALPPDPLPTDTQPSGLRASCWTHDPLPTLVSLVPPNTPDLDFHRGNFAPSTAPECPGLPGGPPEVTFTWFNYLYDTLYPGQGFFEKSLDWYGNGCGYTHTDYHRAAWMGLVDGVPDCTRDEALACVSKTAAAGQVVIVNLAISNGAPDRTEMEPWIRDLAAAGMKVGCLGWQLDQRMTPGELWEYLQWAAPLLHALGCKVAIHWMNDACAWPQAADDPREPRCPVTNWREWHQATADLIDYHYIQVDTEAPLFDARPRTGGIIVACAEVQSALTTQKLVFAEYDTQARFNNPAGRLEVYGDQKGYLTLVRTGMSGCLGGLRGPKGVVF